MSRRDRPLRPHRTTDRRCVLSPVRPDWDTTHAEKIQNERPDFVCKQTGLPARSQRRQETNHLSPKICLPGKERDNGPFEEWSRHVDETIEAMHAAYDVQDE